MPMIVDAISIDYRGAEANLSHIGRDSFAKKAVLEAFRPPRPATTIPTPDIGAMISKRTSGFPATPWNAASTLKIQ